MKHIIKKGQEYDLLVYGPLLCEINELKIEVPDESEIRFLENKKDKTFLIAGGVHSFGIGCTACGVMFPNILGRKFDVNIINNSFNEKNYLRNLYKFFEDNKPPKTHIEILELDYLRQENDVYDKYVEKVMKQMKSKTNHLICWYAIHKGAKEKHEKLKELTEKYSKDKKIKIFDFSFIYDAEYSEMCTHSRNFINDTGNIMIYKKLEKIIKELDNSNKKGVSKIGIFKFNK